MVNAGRDVRIGVMSGGVGRRSVGQLSGAGADIGALGYSAGLSTRPISRTVALPSLRRSTSGPGLLPALMWGPEENGPPRPGAACERSSHR